jgi:hypothetical protein
MPKREFKCTCGLCVPNGRPTHPIYGYDLEKAKTVRCLMCDELIGEREYVEELSTARFGDMVLLHKECESEEGRKKRLRTEQSWIKRMKKRKEEQ